MDIENNAQKHDQQDNMQQSLCEIQNQVRELSQEFQQKIKNDTNQRNAFEKLYTEMKLYKDNFLQAAAKPLIQDIILLYDNTKRQQKNAQMDETKQSLKNTLEEIEEVLYRRDVELICCNSDTLERKWQRAVKVVPTMNREEHDNIIGIIRDGFTWNEKVLRSQEVIVYKYSESKDG